MLCDFCYKPIKQGEKFETFKVFGLQEAYNHFHNRNREDCFTMQAREEASQPLPEFEEVLDESDRQPTDSGM